MTRGSRVRRRVVEALVVALATAGAACSTPPPVASNAVPPPAAAPTEQPIIWAALGGSETHEASAKVMQGSWTQRVLTTLPPTAHLLNVALPDASVANGMATQLPAIAASGERPTVATVWFGVAEPRGSSFRNDLVQIVQRLRDAGIPRIILIGGVDPTDRRDRRASDVEAVAAEMGVIYAAVTVTDFPSTERQNAIADQLRPLITGA